MPSYLLDYIRRRYQRGAAPLRHLDVGEWRFWLEAELRRHDLDGDHRKTTFGRVLLVRPFELIASVTPSSAAPLEFCVRLPLVTTEDTIGVSNLIADNGKEVLDELFSVLSLFTLGRFRSMGMIQNYVAPRYRRRFGRRLNLLSKTIEARLPFGGSLDRRSVAARREGARAAPLSL